MSVQRLIMVTIAADYHIDQLLPDIGSIISNLFLL